MIVRGNTVSSRLCVGCVYCVQVLTWCKRHSKLRIVMYKNSSFQWLLLCSFITVFTLKSGNIKMEYDLQARILICKYLFHS